MITSRRGYDGKARNVIPQSAELVGTPRTFDPELRNLIETRVIAIADSIELRGRP
jgi:metal-dependent amidase/aminoacylase/carboxypeptidase family protein